MGWAVRKTATPIREVKNGVLYRLSHPVSYTTNPWLESHPHDLTIYVVVMGLDAKRSIKRTCMFAADDKEIY